MKTALICTVLTATLIPMAYAESNVVFSEGFENAKANSQGKIVESAWYSPSKLKEGHEVIITREKLNVHSGKFSGKYVNLNPKQSIYMLHEYGVIKLENTANKKLELSAAVKGTGSVMIACVYYGGKKFLRSAGFAAIPGKQALPSVKKPFDDKDWTTCFGEIANIPADAENCKVAIFVSPKSEIYLDDLEIKLVDKK